MEDSSSASAKSPRKRWVLGGNIGVVEEMTRVLRKVKSLWRKPEDNWLKFEMGLEYFFSFRKLKMCYLGFIYLFFFEKTQDVIDHERKLLWGTKNLLPEADVFRWDWRSLDTNLKSPKEAKLLQQEPKIFSKAKKYFWRKPQYLPGNAWLLAGINDFWRPPETYSET